MQRKLGDHNVRLEHCVPFVFDKMLNIPCVQQNTLCAIVS